MSKAVQVTNQAVIGQKVIYRITNYCNNGTNVGRLYMAPDGFSLVDTLPAGFKYVDADPPPDRVTGQISTGQTLTWNTLPNLCAPAALDMDRNFIDVKVEIPTDYVPASNGAAVSNGVTAHYRPLGTPDDPASYIPKSAQVNVNVFTGPPPMPGGGWLGKSGVGMSASQGFTESGHWLPALAKPVTTGHAEAYYTVSLSGVPAGYSAELLDPMPCLDDAYKDVVDLPGQDELRYRSKVIPDVGTDWRDPANLCQTPAFHPLSFRLQFNVTPNLADLLDTTTWRPQAVLKDGTVIDLPISERDAGNAWFKIPDIHLEQVALLRLPDHPSLLSGGTAGALHGFYMVVFGYADPGLEAKFAESGLEAIRVHNLPSMRYFWLGQPASTPHMTTSVDSIRGAYFRVRPKRLTLGALKEFPSGETVVQGERRIRLQLSALVQSSVDVTTPIIMTDLLPEGMSMPPPPAGGYVAKVVPMRHPGMPGQPNPAAFNLPYEVISDFNGSGRTLVRLTLPVTHPATGLPLVPAGNWRLMVQGINPNDLDNPGNRFEAKRDDPDLGATFDNTLRVFPQDGQPLVTMCTSYDTNALRQSVQATTDPYNESGVGVNTTHCLHTASLTLTGTKPAGYMVEKAVQGNADAGPGVVGLALQSATVPGTAVYTLRFINSGSTDNLRNLVLYDVLPTTVNEQGSNATDGRGSEFTTVFTGMIHVPAGATVEYSPSPNACRTEAFPIGAAPPQPPGCVDDWTVTLAPESVRALRIKLPGPFKLGQVVEATFGVKVDGTFAGTAKTAYNDIAGQVSMPEPDGVPLTPVDAKARLRAFGLDAIDDGSVAAPFVTVQVNTAGGGNVATNDVTPTVAGYPLTYTLVSGPSLGTLDATTPIGADGSFQYTAHAGAGGDDSFVYRVCYGTTAICDTATVYLKATPLPPPPVVTAADDAFPAQPASPSTTQTPSVFVGDDIDGTLPTATTVTVSLLAGGTLPGATIDADGRITVPANTPAGTYTVPYQICRKDVPAICDDAVATIVITAPPSPVLTIDAVDDQATAPFSRAEGGELALLDNDTAGSVPADGAVSVTVPGSLPQGVTLLDGKLVIDTTAPVGPHRVTYQICRLDDPSVCDTATATFEVVEGPRADDDTVTALPGQPMRVPVLANDPDRDDFLAGSIRLDAGSSGGVLSTDGKTLEFAGIGSWQVDDGTSTLVFTPAPGFVGTPPVVRYSYRNQDDLISNLATVTPVLSVPNVEAPVATDDTQAALPGAIVTVKVLTNDPQGADAQPGSVQLLAMTGAVLGADGKSLSFANQGTWTVTDATGDLVFTPAPGFTGNPPVVRYTYLDGNGVRSNAATVTVTVTAATPPVATDDSFPAVPGQPVSGLDVLSNDPNGSDAVPGSVQLVAGASGGTLSVDGKTLTIPGVGTWQVNADDTLSFTPERGYTGLPPAVSYTYRSATSNLTSNVATVTMTGDGVVTPIPTLGHLGLLLLAGLLGGLGMRRRRAA